MEVIKRGTSPGEKTAEVTCYTCRSELRVTQAEGKRNSSCRNEVYYSYKCPVCGKEVTVDINRFK